MIDCVGLTEVWANNCFWTFSQCFRITPKKSYYWKRNELTLFCNKKKWKGCDAVCAFKIEIQSDWVSKRYSLLSSCFNIPMRHFCNFQTLSYTICMIMTFKKANICTASPILYSKNQLLHKEEEKKIRIICCRVNYFCKGFPCPVVLVISCSSSCLLDFRLTFHIVAYKMDWRMQTINVNCRIPSGPQDDL